VDGVGSGLPLAAGKFTEARHSVVRPNLRPFVIQYGFERMPAIPGVSNGFDIAFAHASVSRTLWA